MDRLRAALIGCILTGGVLFGARPPSPDDAVIEPVVATSGTGSRIGMTPEQLRRWLRPVAIGADLATLRPMVAPIAARIPPPARQRCNAGRLRRRPRS